MKLEHFDQITPEFVKEMREEMDLSLAIFWGAIGCGATRGYRYEVKQTEIPEAIKRLLFLHYSVGIPTDCKSDEFKRFVDAMHTNNTLDEAVRLMDRVQAMIPQEQDQTP